MTPFDKFAIPQSFTGLHGHSNFSVYDGLGYPQDHIEFVLSEKQGMDSWALTDHGNGNGLALFLILMSGNNNIQPTKKNRLKIRLPKSVSRFHLMMNKVA